MPTIPKRRCTVYAELGLQRWEGAALCKAMGWGLKTPLSHSEVKTLSLLSEHLYKWKQNKLSLRSFIDNYLEELKKDAKQQITPKTS